MRWRSETLKKRLKAGGMEMPVIGKGLSQSEPPHDEEGDMVHNARAPPRS
jgi:hypothetical protein